MNLTNKSTAKKYMDVLLSYKDGQQYCDIFLPLIKAEKEQDLRIKE